MSYFREPKVAKAVLLRILCQWSNSLSVAAFQRSIAEVIEDYLKYFEGDKCNIFGLLFLLSYLYLP